MHKTYAPQKISAPYLPPKNKITAQGVEKRNFLSALKGEDLLILGLIIFLLQEGTADKILIFALIFIFFSGF